jgi:hypothetical protein
MSGNWLKKIPSWEPVIRMAYKLFLQKKNLELVRRHINYWNRKVVKKLLSRDQICRMLSDPVYIGRPQFHDVVLIDDSLSYIDHKTFQMTRKELETIHHKRKHDKIGPVGALVHKYGDLALESFLDSNVFEVWHKADRGRIRKNGTRWTNGINTQVFQCEKCKTQITFPTQKQLQTMKIYHSLLLNEDI